MRKKLQAMYVLQIYLWNILIINNGSHSFKKKNIFFLLAKKLSDILSVEDYVPEKEKK